ARRVLFVQALRARECVDDELDQRDQARDPGPEEEQIERALPVLAEIELVRTEAAAEEREQEQDRLAHRPALAHAALGTDLGAGVDLFPAGVADLLRAELCFGRCLQTRGLRHAASPEPMIRPA